MRKREQIKIRRKIPHKKQRPELANSKGSPKVGLIKKGTQLSTPWQTSGTLKIIF